MLYAAVGGDAGVMADTGASHHTYNSGQDWLPHLLGRCTETERMVILMAFWRACHCRNEVTQWKPVPPVRMPVETKSTSSATEDQWQPPSSGWVKLKVVGSFIPGQSSDGAGMVLRDDVGADIFSSCCYFLSCTSALEAKLTPCMEGVNLAMEWSEKPVIIESDSLQAVRFLQDDGPNRSPLATLVTYILQLGSVGVETTTTYRMYTTNLPMYTTKWA